MRRFPTLKWEPIPASDCIELDLEPMWPWEGLYLEWRGRGILIVARVRDQPRGRIYA